MTTPLRATTDWQQVCVVITTGIVGAAQIGKAAIAAPLIRSELDLNLHGVSNILGAYAMLGAVAGIAAGFVVSNFEMRRVIVAGLALIAGANWWGSTAQSLHVLIAARVLEGVGFLGLAIAAPTLLKSVTANRHLPIVMACWSAYVPAGAALMMLLGPFLMGSDWRSLWHFNAVSSAGLAVLVFLVLPNRASQVSTTKRASLKDLYEALRSRSLLLLAAGFMLYAIQYFALATFLPIFLIERLGVSLGAAGPISALALSANAVGNVCAGLLLRRGVPLWAILATVFATIGVAGFMIFTAGAPVGLAAAGAAACFFLTAFLPASVIATMPHLARSPSQLALSMGLVQQSSAIGQCLGPIVLAIWVERLSWGGVPFLFLGISLIGTAIAFRVRTLRLTAP